MEVAIEYGHEEEQTKKIKSRVGGAKVFVGFGWTVVGWGRGREAVEVESEGCHV